MKPQFSFTLILISKGTMYTVNISSITDFHVTIQWPRSASIFHLCVYAIWASCLSIPLTNPAERVCHAAHASLVHTVRKPRFISFPRVFFLVRRTFLNPGNSFSEASSGRCLWPVGASAERWPSWASWPSRDGSYEWPRPDRERQDPKNPKSPLKRKEINGEREGERL